MNAKYPKLNDAAKLIASNTCKAIHVASQEIEDEGMPYKAQYILEEVIKILKEHGVQKTVCRNRGACHSRGG